MEVVQVRVVDANVQRHSAAVESLIRRSGIALSRAVGAQQPRPESIAFWSVTTS